MSLLKHDDMMIEPLNHHEERMLQLIARGYTPKEISKKLIISIHTYNRWSRNIYQKLQVNDKTSCLLQAIRLGIIDIDIIKNNHN